MNICAKCFNDTALISTIEANGEIGICDITGEKARVLDTFDLSDSFDSFIGSFVEKEDGVPFYSKVQEDWNLFNEEYGRDIFMHLLEERESSLSIDSKVDYAESIYEKARGWQHFKETLTHEYRFMTSILMEEEFEIYDQAIFTHISPIVKNTILFRSRINNNGVNTPFPKDKMGAPPTEWATAGRANPQGIPFLYLSDTPETTFYEIRALFLDIVSTGAFKSNRCLRIVDFTKTTSPFDLIYDGNAEKGIIGEFLIKAISKDLSRPMRRYDSPLEYVPTQFICEYIKYTAKADGIAFKSSLCNGINYVIFDASAFECDDHVAIHKINKVTIEE